MFGSARRITIPRPHGASKRWGQSATALGQHHVRVVEVIRETPDAVTLVLETTDGRPMPFRAGQYLTHCFQIGDATIRRAYSVCLPEGTTLACTVKAIEGGVVSGFVLDGIAPGYEYATLGPSGDFVLPADETAPLAFLAAGSGITPVISMIETALTRTPDRRIALVYASRDERHIIFRDRLLKLASRHAAFTLVHVLSRPGPDWNGESRRLTGARAAHLLAPSDLTQVYLCGPVELMDQTRDALVASGTNVAHVHRERFYAAPHHTGTTPNAPQPITFKKSGRTVTQRPGETVLEAGLREGVKLDFSCTVGGCAACKVKVLGGEVALDEPNCLSADERGQGFTLSCSAYALGPVVIDA